MFVVVFVAIMIIVVVVVVVVIVVTGRTSLRAPQSLVPTFNLAHFIQQKKSSLPLDKNSSQTCN